MNKKVIMGLVAGLMAVSALHAPAAEAKSKGFHFHGHKHHHKFIVFKWHKPYHYSGHSDCGFYLWKWKHTGNFFWKKKYFACIY